MATYDELARYVSDWANRSTPVLSYDTIRQCIGYADDESYRTLRVAALEDVEVYEVDEDIAESSKLKIPADAIEFIQLRRREDTSDVRSNSRYTVAEAKSDIRSFYGDNLTLFSDYAFSREFNDLIVSPSLKEGETWELYLYRRFPEPHQRFTISEENAEAGNLEVVDSLTLAGLRETDTSIASETLAAGNPILNVDGFNVGDIVIGQLGAHWTRDENEKVLLFGALHHAFDYLDEPEQSTKYKAKFEQEIDKLNKEDMMRNALGGNVNVNFYNRLL